MFQKTKWHLAFWYACIAVSISGIFSILIFSGISFQLGRLEEAISVFREYPELIERLPPPAVPKGGTEVIPTIKARIVASLVAINAVVACIAALAGYLLAKKTLKPIEDMVEEQKRFVSDASHEIKTPLAALRSSIEAEMLEEEKVPKNLLDMMKNNLRYIQSIETLTEDLLKLTRYQRANKMLSFSKISIDSTINDAIDTVKPLAQNKKILIEKEITEAHVQANRKLLCELLVILLDNAIKFSKPGGLIRIIAKSSDQKIIITVSDTGIGIPKEKIPYIFNRFYQVESSRSKEENKGFGLGLSIAKNIVEAHQGSITVESEEEKGTTFSIELPVK